MLLSKNACGYDLLSAPTLVTSTSPFLNNIKVGIPRIPYFGGVVIIDVQLADFQAIRIFVRDLVQNGSYHFTGTYHSAQ